MYEQLVGRLEAKIETFRRNADILVIDACEYKILMMRNEEEVQTIIEKVKVYLLEKELKIKFIYKPDSCEVSSVELTFPDNLTFVVKPGSVGYDEFTTLYEKLKPKMNFFIQQSLSKVKVFF